MASSRNPWAYASRVPRPIRWGLFLPVILTAGVALPAWWLTEPLEERGAPAASPERVASAPDDLSAAVPPEKSAPSWPSGRLDGTPAKSLLLEILGLAAERLDKVKTYTATFRKRERIKGKLGPEQTLAMKVRQKPFALYFKFLAPQEGKEVVYAEGHHDNKMIAHTGGVARWLVPRLALPPDHPLAMADSRHPVTEAGLANLTARLITYRKLDLTDPEAETVLDSVTDPDGRTWLHSVHTHPQPHPDRPFARIEVRYDPATFFPIEIRNYDWPATGHEGDLLLAEQYRYDELNLDAPLTALDFDPANPEYAFQRY